LTKLSPQGIILVGFFFVEDAEKLCNYNVLPEFNNSRYFTQGGNARKYPEMPFPREKSRPDRRWVKVIIFTSSKE
jgi:hypothetical protein